MLKKISCLLIIFLVIFAITSSSWALTILKFGGIQAADDTATLAMERMASQVEEKTNGEVKINVFPASQLGDAVSQIESMMMGNIDMFCDAGEWYSQFIKNWNVLGLAFLFKDEEGFRKYLKSPINAEVEKELLEKRGLRVISNNWIRAPRVMNSTIPIKTPADLKGLKMRVPEIKMYLESWTALGTSPTQVAWGEVYLALKQGVVDASEGPLDTSYTMKFYEVAPHIILTNHLRTNMNVVINEASFEKLTKKQQEILVEAANKAGDWFSTQVKEKLNGFVDKMKANGATIHKVNVEEFKNAILPALAYKLEGEGMWQKGLYDEIQSLE